MANHITNDKGEVVIAIGMPGSDAYLECEFPALIEKMRAANTKQEAYEISLDFVFGDDVDTLLRISGWPESDKCDCCDGYGQIEDIPCWKCKIIYQEYITQIVFIPRILARMV